MIDLSLTVWLQDGLEFAVEEQTLKVTGSGWIA
jgi:hypothetical protein